MNGRTLLLLTLVLASPAAADELSTEARGQLPPPSDDWIGIEAAAAASTRIGVLPAVAVFRDNGAGALGARLRAGVLRHDEMAGADEVLGIASFTMRRRIGAVWFEIGGGIAASTDGVAPAIDIGLGWSFRLGSLDAGPSVRYLHVEERGTAGRVGALLFGVEVGVARTPGKRAHISAAPPVAAKPTRRTVAPSPTAAACVADSTPCEHALSAAIDAGLVTIANERITIDVHALLSPSDDRIHDAGQAVLAALAQRWQSGTGWQRARIEGFAELDHEDLVNWRVSQRWAASVRRMLVELGVAPEKVEAIGYGRLQTTEAPPPRQPPNRLEISVVRRPS